MALFGKIKKAFGFSESGYEDEENNDLPSAVVTPINRHQPLPATDKTVQQQHHEPSSYAAKAPDTMPQEIFKSAVKIFNDSLPPLIKDNLDIEAQSKAIYDALDESMKRYLDNLANEARRKTEAQWNSERAHLRDEMDQLQSKAKQVETANNEWKEQKLSAERQKRALSERVHELEKQVAAFDAEREQYELENKSLVNKLRASSIQEGDLGAVNAENAQLRDQVASLQAKVKAQTDVDIEALHQQIADLQSQREKLNSDIELLKKKSEIADGMINDLNHRASSAQQALAQREAELAEARKTVDRTSQVENLSDSLEKQSQTINQLKAQLDDTRAQLQKSNEELEESRESVSLVEDTISKFEQIKASKDRHISQLQTQLQDSESKLQEALQQVESLKSTIENNLRQQAQSEAKLRGEIDQMKKAPEPQQRRRRKKPKISSIDETLDDTDWLVATPPEGVDARTSSIPDNEFGYQEPKRNNPPENAAQMSLW